MFVTLSPTNRRTGVCTPVLPISIRVVMVDRGLAVPPNPNTDTVPLSTCSVVFVSVFVTLSRISVPVPPFFTSFTPVTVAAPIAGPVLSEPGAKSASPLIVIVFVFAVARIVSVARSVRPGVAPFTVSVSRLPTVG